MMSGILDMLAQHMNPGTVNQVSNQIGTDQPTAQRAISAALPTLFGAMAQHASTPQGASDIHQAVTTAPADGAVQPPAAASAGGLLGKILGPRQPEVEQQVAQSSGLSRQQAGKVLMYLAPIAVAVLARHHAQQPQTMQQPGGLSNILQSAQQAMQGANATGGGGLGQVLGGLFG
jgi:hypothetical protein